MTLLVLILLLGYTALLFALITLANRCRERANDLQIEILLTQAEGTPSSAIKQAQDIRERGMSQARADFHLCYLAGLAIVVIGAVLVPIVVYRSDLDSLVTVLFESVVAGSTVFLSYCWLRERRQL